jgi:acyl-CoA synthetase (AMP-forming)/AMP-acid ligase II
MAEATLLISSGGRGAGTVMRPVSKDGLQRHQVVPPAQDDDVYIAVGCGRACCGARIAIVDPEHRKQLQPRAIGEVWVAGPHVAQGYWCNAEASEAAFRARIKGASHELWLRTGDLGFVDEEGELFITGRIKDLIIIRGVNYYPQDIEETVQDCHRALRRHCGAVFGVTDNNEEDRLVVVQEVERNYRQQVATSEIIAMVREAIAREYEIYARDIVLIRTGTLPKTTSGKIQRNLARQMFLAGSLSVLQ